MSAQHLLPHIPEFCLRYLGPVLTELVEVVGLPDTMRIVQRWGGTRLWIPHQAEDGTPLVQYLGRAQADKLCARLGGNRPDIPKAMRLLNVLRDDDIRSNPGGLSVPELALRYGLNERRIYQIRGQPMPPALPPRNERQLSLFAEIYSHPTTNPQKGALSA